MIGVFQRIRATIAEYPDIIAADFLGKERRQGDDYFKREYLGIPSGGHVSPFKLDLYERATQPLEHRQAFDWLKPTIIAHDVGCSKDRSTAVVGGLSLLAPGLILAREFTELRQNLYATARANELALVDSRLGSRNLAVVDLSYDAILRRHSLPAIRSATNRRADQPLGDGMTAEFRPVKGGRVPVYTIGRTYLLDLLHRTMCDGKLGILHGPAAMQAYEQLMMLEIELRESGMLYRCLPGRHDDLAISLALIVWTAEHPHLPYWCRALEPRPCRPRPAPDPRGWT